MMGQNNLSMSKEFVFAGLSRERGTNLCLFVVVLVMYFVTLAGNTLIIKVIHTDARLCTPMYFFLGNLSFLDICYATSVVPQLLVHFLIHYKAISFSSCMAQLFISLTLGGMECILLAAMAYDRYVAVCYPLHYKVIMSKRACIWLAVACFMGGFINALVQTAFTLLLQFCSFNIINHFACEVLAVIKLACSDTSVNETLLTVAGVIFLLIPCIVIILSYIYIIRAMLHIHSSRGHHRAFSTCISHLIVVILFYGTAAFAYLNPKTNTLSNQNKMLAFFYQVVTPMLNPFIYSLRNKDVKGALKKLAKKHIPLET